MKNNSRSIRQRFTACLVMTMLHALSALAAAPNGDLRICRLAGLSQMQRKDDEVSLGVGTTAWNPGSQPLDWYEKPDARHPFIAQALYRIKSGQLQQIGISGVKHGYFVAAANGCDGKICQGHNNHILDRDCMDTYGATLNANQVEMGPRYEINPWTGGWDSTTSIAGTALGPLAIRLRVHDSDLDPGANADASYFIEAYYIHHQNAQPATAAAWQQVVPSKGAEDEWIFDMDAPIGFTPGFAIASAWPGATVSEAAQSIPAVKGVAADGRALIAAKVTPQNGKWRYEYAIFNVDMDRQIRSFSVPLPVSARLEDLYFHAPEQPDETKSAVGGAPTSDSAWQATTEPGRVTWSTNTNPLRWGIMFNFAFTTQSAPVDGQVLLGLFKAGTPASVTGKTRIPGS